MNIRYSRIKGYIRKNLAPPSDTLSTDMQSRPTTSHLSTNNFPSRPQSSPFGAGFNPRDSLNFNLSNVRPTTGNNNTKNEATSLRKSDDFFVNNMSNVNIGDFLAKNQRGFEQSESKTLGIQPVLSEQPSKRNEFEPEPVRINIL